MRKSDIFLLLLLVSFLSSCVKEVDFISPSANTQKVVISGRITNLGERQTIKLMYPGDYKFQNFAPIRNARVQLFDDTGRTWTYTEEWRADTIHTYYLDGFVGEPGRSYWLEAEIQPGVVYISDPQLMPEPILLDSVYTVGEIETKVTPSGVFTKTPTAATYGQTTLPAVLDKELAIHWDLYSVYLFNEFTPQIFPPDIYLFCFITDYFNRQNVNVLRLEDAEPGRVLEQRLGRTGINHSMEHKVAFVGTQFTTSKATAQFLERAKYLIEPSGSIFDVPPAPILGNLYLKGDKNKKALGFFEVASADVKRFFVVNGQLGTDYQYLNSYCYPYSSSGFSFEQYNHCLDCRLLSGSSTDVPVWWQ